MKIEYFSGRCQECDNITYYKLNVNKEYINKTCSVCKGNILLFPNDIVSDNGNNKKIKDND